MLRIVGQRASAEEVLQGAIFAMDPRAIGPFPSELVWRPLTINISKVFVVLIRKILYSVLVCGCIVIAYTVHIVPLCTTGPAKTGPVFFEAQFI